MRQPPRKGPVVPSGTHRSTEDTPCGLQALPRAQPRPLGVGGVRSGGWRTCTHACVSTAW